MKKSIIIAAALILTVCLPPVFAETSSKAKKAEKLAAAGDIDGAKMIYSELMAKDKTKNAELVKEGREGYAKLLLTLEKESLKYKRYDEVEKYLNEIISNYNDTSAVKEANADFVEMSLGVGQKLADAASYDECVKYMNTAMTKVPADTLNFSKIGLLAGLAQLSAAERSLKSKDYEKALNYIGSISSSVIAVNDSLAVKSSELSSAVGKEILLLAESQIKNEKYEPALKNIELAMTAKGNDAFQAQSKYLFGHACRLNNQPAKALSAHKEVLELYKSSIYAPLSAYDMYLIDHAAGNKKEALSDITNASVLSPDNLEFSTLRAQLLRDTGSIDEARSLFTGLVDKLQDQIQKTYTGKEKLQYALGQVYMNLESYSEASIEFDKAITRKPDFTEARKALALAQFKEKNYFGSQKTYETLIKASSDDYDKLKNSFSKTAEPSADEAKTLEESRIALAYLHYQNGLCFEQLGNFEKAELECRLGLEGVPTKEASVTMKRIQKALSEKPSKNTISEQPARAAEHTLLPSTTSAAEAVK